MSSLYLFVALVAILIPLIQRDLRRAEERRQLRQTVTALIPAFEAFKVAMEQTGTAVEKAGRAFQAFGEALQRAGRR